MEAFHFISTYLGLVLESLENLLPPVDANPGYAVYQTQR